MDAESGRKTQIRFADGKVYAKEALEADPGRADSYLANFKGTHPECLCMPSSPLPLYIAKKSHFYLARMPGTGMRHASDCEFYETPADLSGRSVYRDSAIKEGDDDLVEVKSSVSLGVIPSRPEQDEEDAPPAPASSSKAGPKRGKLTGTGMLHLLWERAQFNRWVPRMKNKRSYGVIYRYLLEAAGKVVIKKRLLTDFLYIPEPFRQESANDITKRANNQWYNLLIDPKGHRKRMMVIGEIKGFVQSEFGIGIILRHAPARSTFWMNDEVAERFENLYCLPGDVNDLFDNSIKLIACMTVQRTGKGSFVVHKVALMHVDENYLPCQTDAERELVGYLVKENRRFSVTMRYDATEKDLFPDALLLDVGDMPLPLYAFGVTEGGDENRGVLLREFVQDQEKNDVPLWYWDRLYESSPPKLPAVGEYRGQQGGQGSPPAL